MRFGCRGPTHIQHSTNQRPPHPGPQPFCNHTRLITGAGTITPPSVADPSTPPHHPRRRIPTDLSDHADDASGTKLGLSTRFEPRRLDVWPGDDEVVLDAAECEKCFDLAPPALFMKSMFVSALPNGREVNVGRTAQADDRQAGLSFAINDAFKHVRRRLQDRVRRVQGQVKQHESQPIGTVKSLDASGEFGFLECARWSRVIFIWNSVLDGAYNRLALGTHVAFAEEMGEKGPQASTVKLLGKHRLRV